MIKKEKVIDLTEPTDDSVLNEFNSQEGSLELYLHHKLFDYSSSNNDEVAQQ